MERVWRKAGIALASGALALGMLASGAVPAHAAAPPARDTADGCPSSFPRDQFDDVSSSNVHGGSIDCIVGWGITSGTQPGRYSPSSLVTRGQMASFLARLVERAGGSLPANAPDAFDDDNGLTHDANINRLAAAGVMTGTGPRSFAPAQVVSRDQMATFVARTYQTAAGPSLPPSSEDFFVDDGGNAHEDNINRVAAVGVVSGKTPTSFDPAGSVPRDAMASFLAQLLDKLVEDGVADTPSRDVYLGRCHDGPPSVSGSFSCGQRAINGTIYTRTLSATASRFGSTYSTEFDLSRDHREFTAILRLADDSGAATQAVFEIHLDGQLAASHTIGLGQAVPISVDVTDVLRLRLTVIGIEGPNSNHTGVAVFAEPIVSS